MIGSVLAVDEVTSHLEHQHASQRIVKIGGLRDFRSPHKWLLWQSQGSTLDLSKAPALDCWLAGVG